MHVSLVGTKHLYALVRGTQTHLCCPNKENVFVVPSCMLILQGQKVDLRYSGHRSAINFYIIHSDVSHNHISISGLDRLLSNDHRIRPICSKIL